MNNDGRADIVASNNNNTISFFRNLTTNMLPPVISSVNPLTSTISSTIMITGQNFSTTPINNIVFFGATVATVTSASSSTLSVTVPLGASYQYISVLNLDTKLMGYSPLPFMVTYPTPVGGFNEFVSAINISVGGSTRPWAHVAEDFNGDGKPDIVVTSDTGNATLLINKTPVNSTSFTFTTQALSVSDANVTNIASDDFDGDGRPDLVIGDISGNKRALVYRNISSTSNTVSFSTTPIVLSATANLWSIAIGDIDLDGRPDIVVGGTGSTNISVFRNTSVGPASITFDPKIDFVGNGSTNFTVVLGDMDGDGKLDIITSTDNASNVTVFHNITTGPGSITFDPQISFVNGGSAYGLALGDFNADGRLDIVSTGSANGAYVLLNRGAGRTINFASFYAPLTFAGQANSWGVAVGDVNGDGMSDVALLSNNTNVVSVFRNTTPVGALMVTFGPRFDYSSLLASPLIGNPARISLADFNSDGMLDVVIANNNNNSISILRNTVITPVIVTSFTPTSGPVGTTVTITGLNFNPIPAQNVVFFGATSATVQPGATSTTLTVTVPYGANYQYISVTNLAYNTTGYSAVPFVVTFPTNGVVDLVKDPDITSVSNNPRNMAIGDLNGDGKADLVVANDNGSKVSVYRNVSISGGSLSFLLGATLTGMSARPQAVSIADLDGDGVSDIAVADYGGTLLRLFRNTTVLGSASITFSTGPTYAPLGQPWYMIVSDLDNDGRPDLISADIDIGSNNTISVFRNQSISGTFSFATRQNFTVGTRPLGLVAGDLDKDGKVDLVVVNQTPNTVSILRNTSTLGVINLVSALTLTGFNVPQIPALVDFDGDGNLDLSVSNITGNSVWFFRNTFATTGTISFTTSGINITTAAPIGISGGDMNGDGKVDLVVTLTGSNAVSVFRNASTGVGNMSFALSNYASGTYPENLVVGDMNGDGKPDVAVANYNNTSISLFRNIATVAAPVISSFNPTSGPISTR